MKIKCGTGVLLLAAVAWCDTGVIVPSGSDGPDDSKLSVESMDVRIVIDNGHALVSLKEVFRNRTSHNLEGTYSLALPNGAAVSDFAVWDDLTRIPGVILERKRAAELYEQIRNQAIDPGLLQSGEVSESEAPGQARHSTEFTVKIVPILAYGYKRLEAEYRQTVPVTQLASDFIFALKPTGAAALKVANLSLTLEIRSGQGIAKFEEVGKAYPLQITKQTPEEITASFSQKDVNVTQDFEVRYLLANTAATATTAYRSGEAEEPGYFEASTVLQEPKSISSGRNGGRTVIVLFDTSLSMQWEKLERSFQTLETTVRSLGSGDAFNVLVFNSETNAFSPKPQPATTEAIARALDWVRGNKLRGGTNLELAAKAALAMSGPNTYIVLVTDGEMTEGTIATSRFRIRFDKACRALPAGRRPHIYAMAIGDDANVRLLRRMAEHDGVFAQVNTTEPMDFKLATFVNKIGVAPLAAVNLSVSPEVKPTFVYRLQRDNFPGTRASWVGEYLKPGTAAITVTAGASSATAKIQLPAKDTGHPYLPVAWARARVDALLEKIDREGEDKASIEEIIRLSRKYHFVTPYTSFLAAPRALLRPRLIRPGDPVLRVRTDPSIVSVIAMFPFGLTKPLRYLEREDMWQTRFLAPDDLADGAYVVRLILRDREGRSYREQKTFVISSHAPSVHVQLANGRVRPGEQLRLRVEASATTRTITARIYGAPPLSLRWHDADKANTGVLLIPSQLPAGRYSIHVTAEDIAHNVSQQEVPLEVIP
jgi:Ca-activated chloride channel family protein